ncbi:MAG TPA: hypothetical protein VIJ12_07255 [Candidatus Baltobacteraceae bacterium]
MSFYEKVATVSQLVSALLFAGILVWIWYKLISPAVQVAQEAENKQIAETERHLEESQAVMTMLQAEIEGAGRDADAIRRRALELAAFERDQALARAREDGERTLHSAEGELDRARAVDRERLRTELLDRALEIARSRATQRVDAAVQSKLIDSFIASVERENA